MKFHKLKNHNNMMNKTNNIQMIKVKSHNKKLLKLQILMILKMSQKKNQKQLKRLSNSMTHQLAKL